MQEGWSSGCSSDVRRCIYTEEHSPDIGNASVRRAFGVTWPLGRDVAGAGPTCGEIQFIRAISAISARMAFVLRDSECLCSGSARRKSCAIDGPQGREHGDAVAQRGELRSESWRRHTKHIRRQNTHQHTSTAQAYLAWRSCPTSLETARGVCTSARATPVHRRDARRCTHACITDCTNDCQTQHTIPQSRTTTKDTYKYQSIFILIYNYSWYYISDIIIPLMAETFIKTGRTDHHKRQRA